MGLDTDAARSKLDAQAAQHECSSCRRGDVHGVPAIGFYVGTVVDDNGRDRPFRGYLCDGHLMFLEDDGARLRRRRGPR